MLARLIEPNIGAWRTGVGVFTSISNSFIAQRSRSTFVETGLGKAWPVSPAAVTADAVETEWRGGQGLF